MRRGGNEQIRDAVGQRILVCQTVRPTGSQNVEVEFLSAQLHRSGPGIKTRQQVALRPRSWVSGAARGREVSWNY